MTFCQLTPDGPDADQGSSTVETV